MNKIQVKIFAGLLALTLAGTPTVLAKGESYYNYKEVAVTQAQSNSKNYSEERYKYYFAEKNISNCKDADVEHVHAYVDDSGKVVKWISSEQLEIDGLHWTEEKRETDYEEIECDISEPHAHLYYSQSSLYLIPIYSEEEVVDDEFIKLSRVVFLEKEKCEELRKMGLFRVYDNLDQMQQSYDTIREHKQYSRFTHFMTLAPIYMDEKTTDMKNTFFEVCPEIPREYYGNLLYQNAFVASKEDMDKMPTYVEVTKEDNYQRDFMVSTKDKIKR